MSVNIPKSLEYLRPKASWFLAGDKYEDLVWEDEVQTQPTWDDILAAQVEVENMIADQHRMDAYRRESDPIFFQWQRGEKTRADWDASVNKVRNRFPNKT